MRRVTSELSRRLNGLRLKRKQSLNQTVLDLLNEAVGLKSSSWLDRYTGASERDAREIERAVKEQRKVDPRDWA
ncbi:MAG: hypothetical protein JNM17_04550 [Archangium sp.]|nr:hypothetical protein [Archangium sp.]